MSGTTVDRDVAHFPHRPGLSSPAGSSVSPAKRRREERDLLIRYHRHGDERAREELVERFMPLVRNLARRFSGADGSLDDLVQVASVGLVKAIDGFDLERGTAFSSYAMPTMLGELRRYLRDSCWAAHVPRSAQERALEVKNRMDTLTGDLGRPPTTGELASSLKVSSEEVVEALEAAGAYSAVSLNLPLGRGADEDGTTYADMIGAEDDRFDLIEYGTVIEPTLDALPPRERIILHLRFREDMTQAEIAERIGISQMHVSRLIRRSLARLRAVAGPTNTAAA